MGHYCSPAPKISHLRNAQTLIQMSLEILNQFGIQHAVTMTLCSGLD